LGSFLKVSFAKEPYKRDDILHDKDWRMELEMIGFLSTELGFLSTERGKRDLGN